MSISWIQQLLEIQTRRAPTLDGSEKNTAADRLLNFHSCHEKSIKNKYCQEHAKQNNGNNIKYTWTEARYKQIKQNFGKLKSSAKTNTTYHHEYIKRKNNKSKRKSRSVKKKQQRPERRIYCILCLLYVLCFEILRRKLSKLHVKLNYSYPKALKSILNSNEQKSKSLIYQILFECGKIYNGETKIGLHSKNKNRFFTKSAREIPWTWKRIKMCPNA